ncbi:aspartate 4-decarboxylase [Bifidobacterium gallicum DSM 20093 = LMG 11596]|nr:aspartate 4-decarboxylase [Bifidobacterium gallicum DSM 20093 = LMG 11596]
MPVVAPAAANMSQPMILNPQELQIERNGERSYEQSIGKMSPFERKNLLMQFARKGDEGTTHALLNAGRGNPNWVATLPREAFFLLGLFAMTESRSTLNEPGISLGGMPSQRGCAERFRMFLHHHAAHTGGSEHENNLNDETQRAARFLESCLQYAHGRGWDADALVHEWTEGITGCLYPMPERILDYTQRIVNDYLSTQLCGGREPDAPYGPFDLFATEGGTAAMCYIFYCLKSNFLIQPGDTMALMTPIFTPYLEIPHLDDYGLNVINVNASTTDGDGTHTWQYPDEELEKLADPKVKLLCLVNPSNPPSYAMCEDDRAKLINIVHNINPNLMIITDDVYGTFVPGYHSILHDLPYNTISLYSFSKYFGATGWRLAVTATAPRNVFDELIAALPEDKKSVLAARYSSLGPDVSAIKFCDRMVADSRLVALNGTAGLSTPQQVQMSLFALSSLLDTHGVYQTKMQQLITDRYDALWESMDIKPDPDPLRAGYYAVIDLGLWARQRVGEDFAQWLQQHYDPLDFVVRLAQDTGIVLMDGGGFDAPEWSVRVSLANLYIDDYETIGTHLTAMMDEYAAVWKASVASGGNQ